MLKTPASVVLASLRGSTYRSVRLASKLAAALPAERRVLARRGWAGEKVAILSILRAQGTGSGVRRCRSRYQTGTATL